MTEMYFRNSYSKIKRLLNEQSFVLVYGTQSIGKGKFIKNYFNDFEYVNLNKEQYQELIREDPYRFFSSYNQKTIYDHIEAIPEFISLYKKYSSGFYQLGQAIFISSLIPKENIEIDSVHFLPMSVAEWKQENRFAGRLEDCILQGGYLQKELSAYTTIVKKTICEQFMRLIDVRDEQLVFRFFLACLQQIDEALNLKELALKVGISAPTAAAWIEKLEQIGLIYLLPAYPESFGKRVFKASKLYFTDTGLACHFLKLKNGKQLSLSSNFKSLSNNFYLLEILKKQAWDLRTKKYYYWKESNGHQIRLLIENPTSVDIFEFTTATEYRSELRKELDYFDEISNGKVLSKSIIYGGFKNQISRDVELLTWQKLTPIEL